jgi:hypothetical protein
MSVIAYDMYGLKWDFELFHEFLEANYYFP